MSRRGRRSSGERGNGRVRDGMEDAVGERAVNDYENNWWLREVEYDLETQRVVRGLPWLNSSLDVKAEFGTLVPVCSQCHGMNRLYLNSQLAA